MPRSSRLLASLAALAALGCGAGAPRPSAEEAVLERRIRGLEALTAVAEKGPLIPFDQVLVTVDQALVLGLIEAATPYERVIAGRYRVRIEGASVQFDAGFALVRLEGRASLVSSPSTFADVRVFGGVDLVELDPASGVLRLTVNVMAVEAGHVDVMGLDAPARRLIEQLSRVQIEAFAALARRLEIPVRLEREVTIPGVGPEGGVLIRPAAVPLRLAVVDVKAFRGKLWVAVSASTRGRS